MYKGLQGRPFPGEVVQILEAVRLAPLRPPCPSPLPISGPPCKLPRLGKDLCAALPAPAREGRQGTRHDHQCDEGIILRCLCWGTWDPRPAAPRHPPPLPMALCDIHVAGCGERLPAWGLCDDPLIRPPGEDAILRRCILDSPPGRGMPAAVQMPAVVRMPACHSTRFKGERPIGAATG